MNTKKNAPEDLLNRAYNLTNEKETRELYRDWAETYDETMMEGLDYLTPIKTAELLASYLPDRRARILDVGSGTGLAGQKLADLGYPRIDALDYSREMLAVAFEKKADGQTVYTQTIEADLNEKLAIEDQAYDALICTGTFTHAHVGANCLGELFRILRPGGFFAGTVHLDVWDAQGFAQAIDNFSVSGIVQTREMTKGKYFATDSEPQGWFIVWEKMG